MEENNYGTLRASNVIKRANEAATFLTKTIRDLNDSFEKSGESVTNSPDYEKIHFNLSSIFASQIGKKRGTIIPDES